MIHQTMVDRSRDGVSDIPCDDEFDCFAMSGPDEDDDCLYADGIEECAAGRMDDSDVILLDDELQENCDDIDDDLFFKGFSPPPSRPAYSSVDAIANHQFVTYETLHAAYMDCCRKKHGSSSYKAFYVNETENLLRLCDDLNNRRYSIGESVCFMVKYPKPREVFAADFRDRIVHHLIINRFNEDFEREFIDDTYSCRVGKGTLYGIERVRDVLRVMSGDYKEKVYVFKGDIRNFFMSINKNILARKLEDFVRRVCGDDEYVEWWVDLVRQQALHRPQDLCDRRSKPSDWDVLPAGKSLFTIPDDCGLAIGNLTSQIFANFYLSGFDHAMQAFSDQGVFYGRYVDDFVIMSKDHDLILRMVDFARKYLRENLNLTLHDKKWQFQTSDKGFPFLGVVIKNSHCYVTQRTLNMALRVVRRPTENVVRYVQRVNSYFGYCLHNDTYDFRRKLWREIPPCMKLYIYAADGFRRIGIRRRYIRDGRFVGNLA